MKLKRKLIINVLKLFICIIVLCLVKDKNIKKVEKRIIEKNYFISSDKENKKEEFFAIIEIPTLNLKRELYPLKNKNNNVSQNIEILKESLMPDVMNGNLILAAHSGNSKIAFFRDLHKLKINEPIYIYYNKNKYEYSVTNYYVTLKKDGVPIYRNKNINTLTLTTCAKEYKTKQLVVICELKSINKYPDD